MKKRTAKFVKEHWPVLVVLILFFSWFVYSYISEGIIYNLVTSDTSGVVDFVSSFGVFAWIIFVLLVILEVVLAPMPPLILYVVAGLLFGGLLGGILTLFGNLIGSAIDFKIARNFGKGFVEKRISKKLKKRFDNFFERYGTLSVFILRINPFTSSDLVSYLSGLTKIKLKNFLIATGLGLIPLIFVQTYLGDLFSDNQVFSGLVIIFSMLYLIIFLYLIILILSKKKNSDLPIQSIENP